MMDSARSYTDDQIYLGARTDLQCKLHKTAYCQHNCLSVYIKLPDHFPTFPGPQKTWPAVVWGHCIWPLLVVRDWPLFTFSEAQNLH